MKVSSKFISIILIAVATNSYATDKKVASSHGIDYPMGWQNWSTIAVSHRTDNNTSRVILGNNIAVEAARSGKTNPWPNGAILGKVVWKDTELKDWKSATVPDEFVHAEFMFKNSEKFKESYGWGWARWVGLEQKPFEKGMQVCISCHTPVENMDWVYTHPAKFPK
ncbi:cytochrome P460 family protein [Candidatus Sulfurimonas baltica]|uniref:Cytochrome P460 family protein n=1 Tax=Candidatus Sulfurimonas baltica TaxID=2740404 RepID=A0A7S7RLR5_9BACT|nr:cytochrome P460 family protein [Candidatus Sulfurimonas baltica]QOY51402.1 cytochrome P460 family protein [Candidatus Sulfurimonas baltica]